MGPALICLGAFWRRKMGSGSLPCHGAGIVMVRGSKGLLGATTILALTCVVYLLQGAP